MVSTNAKDMMMLPLPPEEFPDLAIVLAAGAEDPDFRHAIELVRNAFTLIEDCIRKDELEKMFVGIGGWQSRHPGAE